MIEETKGAQDDQIPPNLKVYVENLLHKMKQKNPQHDLNGHRNLWIVKPGQKSRGRGIEVFDNYDKIMNYMKGEKGSKWVV